MDQPLNGIYRVSFDIEIKDTDYLDQSDLAFLFTDGMSSRLTSKVANLQIEQLDKKGEKVSKTIKVGDRISITENIIVRANFYEDDGYLFVGKPSDISNEVGSKEIVLEAGCFAYVNQIHKNGEVDLIDLDRPISATLRVDDMGTEVTDVANVDFITVDATKIEKVLDLDGDK